MKKQSENLPCAETGTFRAARQQAISAQICMAPQLLVKVKRLKVKRDLSATTMANDLPRIDHIIIACKDVKAAANDIYERFGLGSYEGGKHAGWGTQNYITPLGAGYLELAAGHGSF